jgi:hypothetical protein
MHEICTHQDHYIREQIRKANMLWKITLSNGIVCWSDPDRYAEDTVSKEMDGSTRIVKLEDESLKPWNRLKDHCIRKNVSIVKVQVIVMGAPEEVLYENPDGADGIFVKRGFSKSQDMESGDSQAYQNLIVGVLNDEADEIDVVKYSWPHNVFESYEQKRKPTPENIDAMLFKNNSPKLGKLSFVQVVENSLDKAKAKLNG